MAVYIPKVKFDQKVICPKCNTRAVITKIYHLGTIDNEYEGKVTTRDTVFIEWELGKQKPDGTRFVLGRESGTYLGPAEPKKGQKSAMRKLAEACLGEVDEKTFTVWDLLGKSCNVQTGFTSGGNAKIESFSMLNDEQSPLPPVAELFAWSIADPACRELDDSVPDFLMEKAKKSQEYQNSDDGIKQKSKALATGHSVDPDDDSAPF